MDEHDTIHEIERFLEAQSRTATTPAPMVPGPQRPHRPSLVHMQVPA